MSNKYTKILFLALGVAALTSCSTAYRMGQTPDDVYYSPGKVKAQAQANDDEYVSGNNNPQRYSGAQRQQANGYNSYDDYDSYRNDRFLRMSIGSPYRMGAYNDYGIYNGYYNSIGYNSYGDIYSPWNSFYTWNSFYNPYTRFNNFNPYYGGNYYGGGYYGGGYGGGIVIIDKGGATAATPVSRPRAFNPDAYLYRSQSNNANVSRPNGTYLGGRYNNSNTNSGNNSNMRRMPSGNTYYNTTNSNNRSLNNNSSNNNSYSAPRTNSYEAPSRSYTPSTPSSGSSSGSSGGGSSAPVSRPSRGN